MSNKELDELAKEVELLNESMNWWQAQSEKAMDEAWELSDEETDVKKLESLEKRLEYLEKKGHFEAAQVKEFDKKLAKYFTKRMRECQKRKTQDE
jgi:hypothetical protein